jgi:glycerophosphoryl diester phosphodiesterase
MKTQFGEAWDRLFGPPIAHRGLWSPDGPPENSIAAFRAARDAGYGVELDVQLTADGEAVVFHDTTLERMTGIEGRISDHTADDLGRMSLLGTDENIPTLSDVLAHIGSHAMVLIEIKIPYGEVGPLERRVHEIMIDHNGPTCVIGFNPYSHAWFADHFPNVLRGLNSHSYKTRDSRHLAPELRKQYAELKQVAIAHPHFLALGMDMLPNAKADALRAKGMPVIAWTVRSPEEWARVKDHCDNLIFEGFTP